MRKSYIFDLNMYFVMIEVQKVCRDIYSCFLELPRALASVKAADERIDMWLCGCPGPLLMFPPRSSVIRLHPIYMITGDPHALLRATRAVYTPRGDTHAPDMKPP